MRGFHQVTDWTNHIVDNCLRELQSLNKPYKYIITCIIMQKNGAGLNTAASMYWDTEKDNQCEVSFVHLPTVEQHLNCVAAFQQPIDAKNLCSNNSSSCYSVIVSGSLLLLVQQTSCQCNTAQIQLRANELQPLCTNQL
jgi:Tctex-1 family